MPNGNLLIGLRSPTNPHTTSPTPRQAIAVELVNPLKSVTTNNATLGNLYLWQFDGAGIRDLAYDVALRRVLILSGPAGEGEPFKIWTWNGDSTSQPREAFYLADKKPIAVLLADDVAPEGLTIDGNLIWIVFDEGKRQVSGTKCSKLSPEHKTFRAISLPYNF